jgi:hypothetical protein
MTADFPMLNIPAEFVKATNKIAADVRGVLVLLRLVREDVRIIREQVISDANKHEGNAQKNDTGEKETERVVLLSHAANKNSPDTKKADGESKTPSRFQVLKHLLRRYLFNPKNLVELGAFILLGIYTCQTKRTNDIADRTFKASKYQFEIERRPYLWQMSAVGTDKKNMHVRWGEEGGSPLVSVGMEIQNFGQSAAIITKFAGDVELGGDKGYLTRLGTNSHDWRPYSSVVPPGRIDRYTVASRQLIPIGSMGHLSGGTVGAIYRIQYTDTEEHLFESDICVYTPEGVKQDGDEPNWDYCPPDIHLTRLIDCQKEHCED